MTPGLRKFALAVHIILSVGWFGAVVPYLALAIVGLASHDAQIVHAAYLSMELIGWFVIVPFSVAALLSGLVQSLGTQWGLFRHWWILVKFLLTVFAVVVLLQHMEAVSRMSRIAAEATLSGADFHALQIQLLIHPAGGLMVLFAAMTLSVFKPWGMTPYGLRKQHERRNISPADLSFLPESDVEMVLESTAKTPRWVYVVGIHAIGLTLLFLVVHLAGGGVRSH